eukprot:3820467-Prymnesium_polylepis.1
MSPLGIEASLLRCGLKSDLKWRSTQSRATGCGRASPRLASSTHHVPSVFTIAYASLGDGAH